MASFSFAGTDVHVRMAGSPDNPALMLISGLGGTAAFWNAVWPDLQSRYRVMSFDHPGIGASAAPAAAPSVSNLAALTMALLDANQIGSAFLIGHSMGGIIAQSLAIDYPERIGAVVLSSTWSAPDHYFRKAFAQRKLMLELGGPAAYARAQLLAAVPPQWIAENPELADEMERRTQHSLVDPVLVSQRIEALLGFDRQAQLHRIQCPSLVVHCDTDTVVPPHMSLAMAEHLRNPQFCRLSDGGHFAPVVQPRAYADGVLSFLSRLDAPRENENQ